MPIHPCDRCQPIRSAITGTGIDGTAPATPPIRGSNGSTVDGFGTNLLPSGVWSAVPTIGVMGDVTWMAVVGAAVILLALGCVVLLLRRRSNVGRPAAMRAARRAISQSARDHRRRGRGSIRGRGFGGDDNQGYNAGVTSDGGGMP